MRVWLIEHFTADAAVGHMVWHYVLLPLVTTAVVRSLLWFNNGKKLDRKGELLYWGCIFAFVLCAVLIIQGAQPTSARPSEVRGSVRRFAPGPAPDGEGF